MLQAICGDVDKWVIEGSVYNLVFFLRRLALVEDAPREASASFRLGKLHVS